MSPYKRNVITTTIYGAFVLCCLWLTWELLALYLVNFGRVVPPPTQFIRSIIESNFRIGIGSQSASIGTSIISSVSRVVLGLLIATVFSTAVGLFISSSVWIKRTLMPIIRLFAPIAPIAWIPIALVLIGVGNQTAIFIVFMGVFFTLTIVIVQAIEDVPNQVIFSAKTLGANKLQTIRHIIIPFIAPKVVLSLRINFIAAWMAVLAAEMTGLRDGLGAIIMIGRNLFNYELIMMGVFLIGVIGYVTDTLLHKVQEKYFWWGDK